LIVDFTELILLASMKTVDFSPQCKLTLLPRNNRN